MVRPRTFFDLSVDNSPAGRVICELYNDIVPKTCENFRALCTGEKGLSHLSERPLFYKNSIIHRSIKGFMVQGGDFTKLNGSGGESIYGGTFADEDLSQPLDAEGLLCMANKGPDTNGSQFFVTLRECSHLNGKHVVFGKVIRGYDVIQKIAEIPVDEKSRPSLPVTITNCGELELRKKAAEAAPAVKSEPRSAAASDSERSASAKKSEKKRHRSDSASPERRKHHRSSRKEKKKRRDLTPTSDAEQKTTEPHKETEEEYDARLEREELERIEARRKQELEAVKKRYEADLNKQGGVRFKGRGQMRYKDPETWRHQEDD